MGVQIKSLYFRIVLACTLIASGVLIAAAITLVYQTHMHFLEYQTQVQDVKMNAGMLDDHFEMALNQTILWTSVVGLLLIFIISSVVARRISAPLIQMRRTAEHMSKGDLTTRNEVKGHDEIADLGHSLNHLAEQLQRQETLRKHMTADVAHELRTPLATLKSHIEAMIDGVWEPSHERLISCYEEVNRLGVIVGDLEQLAAVESPNFKLNVDEEDMSELVNISIESLRPFVEQKGLTLILQSEGQVMARVDKHRIGQILTNVFMNALKFTPTGGTVTVVSCVRNGKPTLMIQDTGIGIDQADLPYIFERFYRTEKSRARASGGSGLGLTIVKRLVENHGGSIEAKSVKGEGTRIVIQFP